MSTKIDLLNTKTKANLFSLASTAELSVRKSANKTELVNLLNNNRKIRKADLVEVAAATLVIKRSKEKPKTIATAAIKTKRASASKKSASTTARKVMTKVKNPVKSRISRAINRKTAIIKTQRVRRKK